MQACWDRPIHKTNLSMPVKIVKIAQTQFLNDQLSQDVTIKSLMLLLLCHRKYNKTSRRQIHFTVPEKANLTSDHNLQYLRIALLHVLRYQ